MIEKWRRTGARELHHYRVFQTREATLVHPHTGVAHPFFVIDSEDWVNVIAVTADGRVICVRQYRVGVDRVTLEIPGGVVDRGEHPRAAAARELAEETGWVSDRWTYLGWVEPNPAIQSNRTHTYLAEDCRPGGAQELDEREVIEVELLPVEAIPPRLADGTISHALVGIAFQRWDLYRAGHPMPPEDPADGERG
jgi:ADP-ribose pyrophosphatase